MTRRWVFRCIALLAVVCGFASPAQAETLPESATAIFSGGCFWCMEAPFDALSGVLDTTSGYTGGTVENPSYAEVSNGGTGHVEAVQITYDPQQVTYETLLGTFWRNVDPLDDGGQFCDRGSQYRSVIFYADEAQREAAESSKADLESAQILPGAIATEILPASEFYPAEAYHQNYYQTHPIRYKVYRFGCGRDQRLAQLWGETPAHE